MRRGARRMTPAPPTSSSSAAAWSGRRPRGACGSDGFAGRVVVVERDPHLRPRVVVPGHGRHPPAVRLGGVRADGAAQRRAVARVRRADAHAGAHAARVVPPARLPVPGRRRHLRRRWPRGPTPRTAAGAVQRRLSVDEIAALVPGLMLDDIRWGLFGPEDGYANPREVLFGLRAARPMAAGAEYVHDEVIGVDVAGGRVTGVQLARAGRLDAPVVVNAAGALSGRVAALAGLARAGRAGAPAALPLHAAPPLADALPDGRRSGRRALASRRPGRRPASPIASSSPSPGGTSRPASASTATTRAGSTSSIRRWCGACRRWPRSRTCTAGRGSTR